MTLKIIKTTSESRILSNISEPEPNEFSYLIIVREPAKNVSEKVEYLKEKFRPIVLEKTIRTEIIRDLYRGTNGCKKDIQLVL